MTSEYENYHTIIILHIEYRIINCKGKGHESKYIEFMNADFQLLERLYNKNYIHSLNIIQIKIKIDIIQIMYTNQERNLETLKMKN